MKVIYATALVTEPNADTFLDNISKHIDNYQIAGYDVEIQYKPIGNYFSALIIAYKEKK